MIILAAFPPFQPTPGLALWSLVIFLLFWWLMSKYAFKPIASALKTRETDIQTALDEANKAKSEMANLKAENERLLTEAREEKAIMLREAKDSGNKIIADAKDKAKAESSKLINSAKLEIDNQKKAALTEVKNKVGVMALDIAEKVIKRELKGNPEQEGFVNQLVEEINLN
jgi:F-type H+-transporting ATPase subunit b